jgi:hypothetical protein
VGGQAWKQRSKSCCSSSRLLPGLHCCYPLLRRGASPDFCSSRYYYRCCWNSPRGSSRTPASRGLLSSTYRARDFRRSEQGLGFEGLAESRLGFRSPGMDSSGDEGAAPPAAVGGAGASGSGGKPPVKRVMKTPYQLEVLERTYSGSWI